MTDKELELKKIVLNISNKIKAGGEPENPRIELKRQWPVLTGIKGNDLNISISKFLKEFVALANFYGPWKGYLIIGIDEKNGNFFNSPFSKSGLRDSSDFSKMVSSKVDGQIPFLYDQIQIEDKIISIFEIEPSIEKPHILLDYHTKNNHEKNYIPVKYGSDIKNASKSEIDLMYYDRGNVIPEYKLDTNFIEGSYYIRHGGTSTIMSHYVEMTIIFENDGRKPITIKEVALSYELIGSKFIEEYCDESPFLLEQYLFKISTNDRYSLNHNPLIIKPGEAKSITGRFNIRTQSNYKCLRNGTFTFFLISKDIFDKKYVSRQLLKVIPW